MRECIVAVDLEMTGLRVKTDRILEIGAVKIEDGKLTETFEMMVNPHRKLEEKIIALTGITDEMAGEGAEESDAIRAFLDFAGDAPLLGHNLIFDYSFLKQAAVNHGFSFERSGIDTLKIARAVCGPQPEKKTLDALCEYYEIRREQNHRALDDARAAAQLYGILLEQSQKSPAEENEKLFRPIPLQFHVKKQGPATPAQKRDLNHFIIYHRIDLGIDPESLTKSEASRLIDRLSIKYGRIRKKEDR